MDLLAEHLDPADVQFDLPPYIQEEVHEALNEMFGAPEHVRRSLAPRCVNITRDPGMKLLATQPYMVLEKTNGERVLLLAWMMRDGYASIIVIDLERRFAQLRAQLPAALFRGGTLIDGELLPGKGGKGLEMHVFDMVAMGGERFSRRNYITRMKQVDALLQMDSIVMPDGLLLVAKRPWLASDLAQLLQRMEDSQTPYDGYIFAPINHAIKTGTDHRTLRFKMRPTVDLLVRADGELCTHMDGVALIPLGEALPGWHARLIGGLSVNSGVHEFVVQPRTKRSKRLLLTYEGPRAEKLLPNHVKTVKGVFGEVLERITLQEIVDVLKKPYRKAAAKTRGELSAAWQQSNSVLQGRVELVGAAATRAKKKKNKQDK